MRSDLSHRDDDCCFSVSAAAGSFALRRDRPRFSWNIVVEPREHERALLSVWRAIDRDLTDEDEDE